MPPPPLRPESKARESKPNTSRGKLQRVMELIAESDAGDYLTAIAAGVKAFREARRLRDGKEAPREPEERDI